MRKEKFEVKGYKEILRAEARKKIRVKLPKVAMVKEEPSLDHANITRPSQKGAEAKAFDFCDFSGSTKAQNSASGEGTEAESSIGAGVSRIEKATITLQFEQVKIGA